MRRAHCTLHAGGHETQTVVASASPFIEDLPSAGTGTPRQSDTGWRPHAVERDLGDGGLDFRPILNHESRAECVPAQGSCWFAAGDPTGPSRVRSGSRWESRLQRRKVRGLGRQSNGRGRGRWVAHCPHSSRRSSELQREVSTHCGCDPTAPYPCHRWTPRWLGPLPIARDWRRSACAFPARLDIPRPLA